MPIGSIRPSRSNYRPRETSPDSQRRGKTRKQDQIEDEQDSSSSDDGQKRKMVTLKMPSTKPEHSITKAARAADKRQRLDPLKAQIWDKVMAQFTDEEFHWLSAARLEQTFETELATKDRENEILREQVQDQQKRLDTICQVAKLAGSKEDEQTK